MNRKRRPQWKNWGGKSGQIMTMEKNLINSELEEGRGKKGRSGENPFPVGPTFFKTMNLLNTAHTTLLRNVLEFEEGEIEHYVRNSMNTIKLSTPLPPYFL